MDVNLRRGPLLACVTGLAVSAALTTGCGSVAGTAQVADHSPVASYRNSELTFRYPAGWKAYPFRWSGVLHFRPMVYVSTQPVHDPCRTSGNSTTCSWPVRRLQPDGVLVSWEDRGFPGWSLQSEPGTTTRIGQRAAKRVVTRPGACGAIGGDLTLEVAIARPEPSNWTQATVCVRGPHLARNERRIDALLASTRFLSS
jgi:hypothetical protein